MDWNLNVHRSSSIILLWSSRLPVRLTYSTSITKHHSPTDHTALRARSLLALHINKVFTIPSCMLFCSFVPSLRGLLLLVCQDGYIVDVVGRSESEHCKKWSFVCSKHHQGQTASKHRDVRKEPGEL